jgi:CelD/BcsL family acetyltransferase involved in cellulose biosynthesis
MSSGSIFVRATDLPASGSQLSDSHGATPVGLRVADVSLNDSRLAPFVSAHPCASVYHHPAWLRALRAEYDREILMLVCEDRDSRLLGMFPLMYTRGLPLWGGLGQARLSSLPRTPIAGPLCTSQEAARLLVTAAIDRVSVNRKVRLQIKTEGPVLDGLVDNCFGAHWRNSFIVPLPEDPAQLRIQNHSVRKNVKRAQNSGLQIRMANSGDDLSKWYALYLRTMRRVVVPARPLRFFRALWEHMEPLGLIKTILVERHGGGKSELIAGLIFLTQQKRFSAGFLACPAEYFPMRPNDLIHWEGIHWAARNGFREYDFGEVPEGDSELARFKAKWGAEERPLHRYYYPQLNASGTDSSVLSRHQALFGKVWQQMPLGVTARLGDLIYSYL